MSEATESMRSRVQFVRASRESFCRSLHQCEKPRIRYHHLQRPPTKPPDYLSSLHKEESLVVNMKFAAAQTYRMDCALLRND